MSIIDDLIRDEGLRLKPYRDTVNKLTIGVGRNLDDVGISESEARTLLANDITRVETDLKRTFTWFEGRPEPVRRALMNMCFQMGLGGLLGFQNMLKAIAIGDYEKASQEALDSQWAQQVPSRAQRVTGLFRESAKS